MSTADLVLSPQELNNPPDIDFLRPKRCPRCGAVARGSCVGMHGDGRFTRILPWPVQRDDGEFCVEWVPVVGRRFYCPRCRVCVRVHRAGVRKHARFGAAVLILLFKWVAGLPLGDAITEAEVHRRVHGKELPISERARPGKPRWYALRRWSRQLSDIWPNVSAVEAAWRQRLDTLLSSFGLTTSFPEVLDAAVRAHARGGTAM